VRLERIGPKRLLHYRSAGIRAPYVGPAATVRDGIWGSRRLRLRPPK